MAMPVPPMVPAPMTPTLWISRAGTSAGTSGILLAARSAKNRWRSARDRASTSGCTNRSRSTGQAVSNFALGGGLDGVHALDRRAGKFLAMPLTMLRANWK